jgi:hypothetical protein
MDEWLQLLQTWFQRHVQSDRQGIHAARALLHFEYSRLHAFNQDKELALDWLERARQATDPKAFHRDIWFQFLCFLLIETWSERSRPPNAFSETSILAWFSQHALDPASFPSSIEPMTDSDDDLRWDSANQASPLSGAQKHRIWKAVAWHLMQIVWDRPTPQHGHHAYQWITARRNHWDTFWFNPTPSWTNPPSSSSSSSSVGSTLLTTSASPLAYIPSVDWSGPRSNATVDALLRRRDGGETSHLSEQQTPQRTRVAKQPDTDEKRHKLREAKRNNVVDSDKDMIHDEVDDDVSLALYNAFDTPSLFNIPTASVHRADTSYSPIPASQDSAPKRPTSKKPIKTLASIEHLLRSETSIKPKTSLSERLGDPTFSSSASSVSSTSPDGTLDPSTPSTIATARSNSTPVQPTARANPASSTSSTSTAASFPVPKDKSRKNG